MKCRIILVIVILQVIAFFAYKYIYKNKTNDHATISDISIIGGDFILQNQYGEEISNENFLNHYTMVAFGFSRCPKVCPTQLGIISNILEEINNKKLQAFFITIDPTYDTVDKLKSFHEKFDERIQMLTGSQDIIEQLIRDYKVYVSLSEKPEESNHSTIIYIMDSTGKYLEHLNFSSSNLDETIERLHEILNKGY